MCVWEHLLICSNLTFWIWTCKGSCSQGMKRSESKPIVLAQCQKKRQEENWDFPSFFSLAWLGEKQHPSLFAPWLQEPAWVSWNLPTKSYSKSIPISGVCSKYWDAAWNTLKTTESLQNLPRQGTFRCPLCTLFKFYRLDQPIPWELEQK